MYECVHVCTVTACREQKQKQASKVELQVIGSHHVGAENRAQDLYENSLSTLKFCSFGFLFVLLF